VALMCVQAPASGTYDPNVSSHFISLRHLLLYHLSGHIERVGVRRVAYNYLAGNSSKETICKL
jgi:hypothetical protein